jgi:hypothetical protein
MANAPNRPRNSRTANGLKRGIRAEWDEPKPKRKPEPEFDPIKFLNDCINDKEAYSAKERAGFRKVLEQYEKIVLENESLYEAEWDRNCQGAYGKFLDEKE